MKILNKAALKTVSGGTVNWENSGTNHWENIRPQPLPGGGHTYGYPVSSGSNSATWLAGNSHGIGLSTSYQSSAWQLNAGLYARPSLAGRPPRFYFGLNGRW